MSLINQVLQDLDRRHASGAAMPAAVKTAAAPMAPAPAWRLGVLAGAVLLVAGGSAALAWSMASRSALPAAVAHAPATSAVAVPAPTPVVVVPAPAVSASPTAPVVAAAPSRVAMVAPPPSTAVAVPAAPVHEVTKAETPKARENATRAVDTADMPSAALASVTATPSPAAALKPTAAPAPFAGESRIEKRTSGRTAHERAEGEYQRGVALHQAGQYAEAAQAYTAALREESSLVAARQALAGALINQGKADEARTVLTEGLAMAPQNMGLAMMLARLHVERGELQRAAEVLQPTDTASMSAEDHAFRAAVLQRINHHAEASAHFAAALRTVPGNSVWWMGLGISQAADGHADNAKEAFNRARSSGGLTPELAQYVEQRLRQL